MGISERLSKRSLILILVLCWSAGRTPGQDALPTIRILPEDIVQDSIQQGPAPLATNKFTIRWAYTEPGARKMLTFRRAHAGQKVIEQVGSFEFRPTIWAAEPQGWREEGWLKRRTDKFFAVDEGDAKKILAGLKGQ